MAQLFPEQIQHVDAITKIYKNYKYALDLSSLGSGKTFSGVQLAFDSKCPNILVICPKCVEYKWVEIAKLWGLQPEVVTYNSFRSVRGSQPKHGYLTRKDYKKGVKYSSGLTGEQDKTEFRVTQKWLDKVNSGVFVIIDEFQCLKNFSDQTRACLKIFASIASSSKKNPSKILLISGSPFDKREQVLNFYRMIGIMKSDQVLTHNPRTFEMQWKGMQEIYDYTHKIDSKKTQELMPKTLKSIAPCHQAVYNSFQNIVKPVVANCMKPQVNQYPVIVKEAHYYLDNPKAIADLSLAIKGLKMSAQIDPHTGRYFQHAYSAISKNLHDIEVCKLPIFHRIIEEHLLYSKKKVVITFNFTESLQKTVAKFVQYNPLVLNGQVNGKERQNIIKKFLENTSQHRLLISNLKVCSTGIDLDDKYGRMPRFAIVSPTYSSQDIYQFGHRFDRKDTRSQGEVHIVFCKEASELKILAALARKGTIMKETTPLQCEIGIKFPGEYPEYQEPEDYKKKIRDKHVAMGLWICKKVPELLEIQTILIQKLIS